MVISKESLNYFDSAIYFPLLLIVLERDREEIATGDFRFKKPYIKVIEQAEKRIKVDFKKTNAYLRKNKMKLNKLGNDGTFTEYEFIYNGYQEKRRYLNARLRNRTEELLQYYLAGERGSFNEVKQIAGSWH